VRELCKRSDIVALQETWLYSHDINILGQIDNQFSFTGKSSIDLSSGVLRGRPHGGVAILWRSSAFRNVSVLKCTNDRLVAIKVSTADSREIIVMCVYMPTDESCNLPLFTQCLGEMNAIIEDNNVENVYMLGDFNAHPTACFGEELFNFCRERSWICADVVRLGIASDTHTYVSEVHGCHRWLDHCVVSTSAMSTILNIEVVDDVYWSDHYPLKIVCNLNIIKNKVTLQNETRNDIIWGLRTTEESDKYHELCNNNLKQIHFPNELHRCADRMCHNVTHLKVIDKLYSDIKTTLTSASVDSRTRSHKSAVKGKCILGWNKHVADAHRQARLDYKMYLLYGKPSCGAVFEKMCLSRRIFKARLKFCQNNQDQIRFDILASQHSKKQFSKFWKSTKSLNGRVGLPASVDGLSDQKCIANAFKDQFKVISPRSSSESVVGDMVTTNYSNYIPVQITSEQVADAIKNMKRGKSPGHDGLSIEHLQYAGGHIARLLSMLYTLCIRHAYLPSDLTKTIVIPLVKNSTGDLSDKSNYRPISLATVLAKVLDRILDVYLSRQIKLNDAQFGFREGLSTENAILALKHTANYYVSRETPIFACFLDLSKAFDLVSYDVLWAKLKEIGIPHELIGILSHWYQTQINVIKWANTFSDPFTLNCGVRQGGLTSPRLFNVYVDQLIGRLSSMHVGCRIDNTSVNNISYADDMALLSPSVAGIRKLLEVCQEYAVQHGLKYNENKSEFMVIKGRNKGPANVPPILLNGTALNRVTHFKYLGHILTEDLKDDMDMERERRALSVRGGMLARRFAKCSTEVKVTLFRAYCQCFYTSGLWAYFKQKSFDSLRVQYNNIFRALVRLPRYCSASGMFADAHVDDFYAIMRKNIASVVHRMRGSSNGILRMIAERFDSVVLGRYIELHVHNHAVR
jgi:exonuclease III